MPKGIVRDTAIHNYIIYNDVAPQTGSHWASYGSEAGLALGGIWASTGNPQ